MGRRGAHRSLRRHEKARGRPRAEKSIESNLGLLDQAGFDRLDGDQHALGSAIGQLHADALKVRAELTLRDASHVRADAAALLGLTLAVDDRAFDRTTTGDCTDSSHGDFELVKGSE